MTDLIKDTIDTEANWTANNPVLEAGRVGGESDTGQAKLGNGTDAWNDLPYIGEGLSSGGGGGGTEDTFWFLDLNFQFGGSIQAFTTSSSRATWGYTSGEFFSNGAQNESISFQGWWGPGEYTIDHIGVPSGNRGIITWAVQNDDGSYTDVGTVDWSIGGGATNKSLTFDMPAGVVDVKRRLIRAKAATKNGSASAYYLDFMRLWIVKTGT